MPPVPISSGLAARIIPDRRAGSPDTILVFCGMMSNETNVTTLRTVLKPDSLGFFLFYVV